MFKIKLYRSETCLFRRLWDLQIQTRTYRIVVYCFEFLDSCLNLPYQHFNVVYIQDDDASADTKYDLDGTYTPRVFFLGKLTPSMVSKDLQL